MARAQLRPPACPVGLVVSDAAPAVDAALREAPRTVMLHTCDGADRA